MTAARRPSWRLLWILPAGLSLLAGLDAALLLLGVGAPVTAARLPDVHGMLMVLGFVGTLISLERATALGRWYGFFAPALLGAGGIALLADPVPLIVAKVILVAGTLAFTLVYIPLWHRQFDEPLLVQLLGAALGCAGAVIWLNQPTMEQVLPWLIGFVVLTIAAERVELARITMGPHAGVRLLVHAWTIVIALLIGVPFPDAGAIALGLALAGLVSWLVVHDIARRTIRAKGAARYMAACILSGYVWLAVAAVALLFGSPTAQPAYDAVVHAVFLGYTISMIMAHATTILPAVLHIALPYRPAFWVPAAILQLSLVVRLWVGDALGLPLGWQVGGVLGVIALLAFVIVAVTSAVLGPTRKNAAPVKKTGAARTTTSAASGTVSASAPIHEPAAPSASEGDE
ncbi:hypothetical protein [Microbacterium terrisoli]|uniref:hypothetical protein n=1 Tax=Microbacterium terrisoli TaxID=3242192 RepID=UPI00280403D1|nr:hypothetical protein [Microbacterium protaetiae]